MEQGLAQLKDIDGLDAISWWPPAIGWWVVIGLFVLIIVGLVFWYRRRRTFLTSWQRNTLSQLSTLENTLTEANSLAMAIEISELIRRIVIEKYSRNECAGLEGEEWLSWLKKHDPKQFGWKTKAKWLTDVPYAPTNTLVPNEEIVQVINAIRRWVK